MEDVEDEEPRKRRCKFICNIFMWIVIYFAYVTFGGFCMYLIEKDFDYKEKTRLRNALLAVLDKYNVSKTSKFVYEFINATVLATEYAALHTYNITDDVESNWNLITSIFFCNTIVTTIGYGNMFPRTDAGREFVIFYALVGIPITGIVLLKIGSGFTSVIEKMDDILGKIMKKLAGGSYKDNYKWKIYIRVTQLVITIILYILLFMVIPAIIATKIEHWDFVTALYFYFITMTTIGLGDVVPGRSEHIGDKEKEGAMVLQLLSVFDILVGLAALTLLLNIIGTVVAMVADNTVHSDGFCVNTKKKLKRKVRKLQLANKNKRNLVLEGAETRSNGFSNTGYDGSESKCDFDVECKYYARTETKMETSRSRLYPLNRKKSEISTQTDPPMDLSETQVTYIQPFPCK